MPGKSPYYNWLAAALGLWCLVYVYAFEKKKALQPEPIASSVAQDIAQRNEALEQLLQKPELIRRMLAGTLTNDEVRQLTAQPFFIYGFRDNTLLFWNSNTVIETCNDHADEGYSLVESNSIFLKRCLHFPFLQPNETIVVLFPVVYRYPFQNQYLQDHFAAGKHIPPSTTVSKLKKKGSVPVKGNNGAPLFYLHFEQPPTSSFMPDGLLIGGVIIALFVSFLWINLIAVALARRKSPGISILFVAGCILLFRLLVYWLGYPFKLQELPVFAKEVYASSAFFPSLPDLIINLLCLLWLLVLSVSFGRNLWQVERQKSALRSLLSIFITILLCCCAFVPVALIKSLVLDSGISFDVGHFNNITPTTIAGLFTICLIATCFSLLVYLLHASYRKLQPTLWRRYVQLLGGLALAFCLLKNPFSIEWINGVAWLLLLVILLDLPFIKKPKGLFAPGMIFWAAFIAACCTALTLHYNALKEERNRRSSVERIVDQRDRMFEFYFEGQATQIQKDKWLIDYVDSPSANSREVIDEYISTTYMTGPVNRYDPRIYLFDKNRKPLFNNDTISFERMERSARQAIPTNNYLFFKENAKDRRYYLAYIPVRGDSSKIHGYVFLDMSRREANNRSVYPELLQPEKLKNLPASGQYSYAVYEHQQLVLQNDNYPFPAYLDTSANNIKDFIADKTRNHVFRYQPDSERTVIIIYGENATIETITMFSYLLGLFIIFALITLVFKLIFLYLVSKEKLARLLQFTLRKRIQFAMVGLVSVSFLIIGGVTIWFFVNQYDTSNKTKLQNTMQTTERSIQQFLKDKKVPPTAFAFSKMTESFSFKSFINGMVNNSGIDINVYDSLGTLKSTSQYGIYNKSILEGIMMPSAYARLSKKGSVMLIQEEHIGKLNYLSCYLPLRVENGGIVGFVNIPFFASQKELNVQISNILVGLINLYAFIFLLSGLLTVFITDWLTKALQMIGDNVRKLNLQQQNELLKWPYDDEIGLLVNEHNKMLKKLEGQAALLAQSERESAWREMARQVAHEIKNPLTPMKLNLQHLQRIMKAGQPDAIQRTEHIAASIIEQIDNLSHISSAFSDFAKMPEALPEEVELNELLQNAVELYQNNLGAAVTLAPAKEPLNVFVDRSQLLRVCNNLIQNAMQAIPEERTGLIEVIAERKDDYAFIEIRDNGAGIPEEITGKIFSPYFTTKGSGTGLGLAMTRRIIEFWKGKIWFETKLGEGTVFYIKLPLNDAGE